MALWSGQKNKGGISLLFVVVALTTMWSKKMTSMKNLVPENGNGGDAG